MALSDYSDLEKEIQDAPELKILPKDTEVKARIIKVDHGEGTDQAKKSYGVRYYQVTYDVPSEPLCPMFNDFFWDLQDKDKLDEKDYAAALRQYRDFGQAFNIDWGRPVNWVDDFPGLEGWMVLKVVKDKSGEYPDKNGVKNYVVPK